MLTLFLHDNPCLNFFFLFLLTLFKITDRPFMFPPEKLLKLNEIFNKKKKIDTINTFIIIEYLLLLLLLHIIHNIIDET